jgi:hypothetical protein
MKYLCQVYFDAQALSGLSKEEMALLDRDSLAYDDELSKAGHMIHAEALQSPDKAATVRVRNGKVAVSDGPFAETKEHLGGFILVEARDLNDAIRIAAGIPLARLGSVEVRPIYDIPRRAP